VFDSLMIAGDEAFQQGRYSDALAKYSEASHIEPDRPLVIGRLALAMTVLGRGDEHIRSRRPPARVTASRR
jgi:hypothetical protein